MFLLFSCGNVHVCTCVRVSCMLISHDLAMVFHISLIHHNTGEGGLGKTTFLETFFRERLVPPVLHGGDGRQARGRMAGKLDISGPC